MGAVENLRRPARRRHLRELPPPSTYCPAVCSICRPFQHDGGKHHTYALFTPADLDAQVGREDVATGESTVVRRSRRKNHVGAALQQNQHIVSSFAETSQERERRRGRTS